MSTLVEVEDRPSCLPGIKNEIHFPKIKTSFSTPTVRTSIDSCRHFDNNNNLYSGRNFCHNIDNCRDTGENKGFSRSNEVDNKSYIPPSVCETSSMLKLPNIGQSKGTHITSRASGICKCEETSPIDEKCYDQLQTDFSHSDSSRKLHSEEEMSTSITEKESQISAVNDSSISSASGNSKDNMGVRFPSISQRQNGHISNTSCSRVTINNPTQVSQETATSYFSNPSRQNMTLVGMKSKLSPRTDSSNIPISVPGKYALLLPISTSQGYSNRDKGKRKRKSKR